MVLLDSAEASGTSEGDVLKVKDQWLNGQKV